MRVTRMRDAVTFVDDWTLAYVGYPFFQSHANPAWTATLQRHSHRSRMHSVWIAGIGIAR